MIIPTSNAATQTEARGRMEEDIMASLSLNLQTTRIPFGSITLLVGELLGAQHTVTVG
jgi:hypothetical protein